MSAIIIYSPEGSRETPLLGDRLTRRLTTSETLIYPDAITETAVVGIGVPGGSGKEPQRLCAAFLLPDVPSYGWVGRGAARLASAISGTPTRSIPPTRLASVKRLFNRTGDSIMVNLTTGASAPTQDFSIQICCELYDCLALVNAVDAQVERLHDGYKHIIDESDDSFVHVTFILSLLNQKLNAINQVLDALPSSFARQGGCHV